MNIENVQYRRKDSILSNISTSEHKSIHLKKKEQLDPIKVKSSNKNIPKIDRQITLSSNKVYNIKIKKSSSINKEKIEKQCKLTHESEKYPELKLTYASKSKQGINISGMKKINQDSYLVKTSIFTLKDFSVFGVFDGHGKLILI